MTTSYKHGRWIRLAASSIMWMLGAADVVEMVYIGYLQDYPILTWSYLLAPWWASPTVYVLTLVVFSEFGVWRSTERHPKLTHGR